MSSSDPVQRDGPAEPPDENSRRRDPMAPPEEPCECFCLHCRRVFMSDKIWFQRVINSKDGFDGFWMCPTPNCGGAGFSFDIFPTDPDHQANEGWHSFDDDDDEEGEYDEEWDDEEFPEELGEAEIEYDPEEPGYKAMEDWSDDEDEDADAMEGEEWKLGLAPGERPKVEPPPPGVEPRNWAEQEALYDAPDRRPREVDWSDRPARSEGRDPNVFGEDDIPF